MAVQDVVVEVEQENILDVDGLRCVLRLESHRIRAMQIQRCSGQGGRHR